MFMPPLLKQLQDEFSAQPDSVYWQDPTTSSACLQFPPLKHPEQALWSHVCLKRFIGHTINVLLDVFLDCRGLLSSRALTTNNWNELGRQYT